MYARALAVTLALGVSFALAAPASADFCLQFGVSISNPNCPLTGDLGFFRFKGRLPKKANKTKPLHGRVAGVGPAYGTATVYSDKSGVELGATFFADGMQGQFDVTLWGPGFTAGDGDADYGTYDVNFGCDVNRVSCNLEP